MQNKQRQPGEPLDFGHYTKYTIDGRETCPAEFESHVFEVYDRTSGAYIGRWQARTGNLAIGAMLETNRAETGITEAYRARLVICDIRR